MEEQGMRGGAVKERIVRRVCSRRLLAGGGVRAAGAAVTASALSACSIGASAAGTDPGKIVAVGAENEYADVISQVGGQYVQVSGIMSNPNTDPHTFEASPAVAREISAAQLIVQNGVSYDTFMSTIESAASGGGSKVIDVQTLLGLPDSTANPHLWYNPTTMPKVADAIATDLAAIQPAHAAYFKANAKSFVASLDSWYSAIAAFKKAYAGVPVATTEPVADYMLQAVGADNLTPWTLQADIMNGVDPSPQNVAVQRALFTEHKVKVFLYNQQVTETMTPPGYDYQAWMLTEVRDLRQAVVDKVSTEHL